MRPVAPLAAEYRASASLYLLVGVAGLIGDMVTRDVSAGRSVAAFAIMTAVTTVVLVFTGLGWLRGALPAAAPLPAAAAVDPPVAVWRRAGIEVSLVALLMVAGLAGGRGIGVVIAGIAFGVGLVSAAGLNVVGRHEAARGARVFRETPRRFVASGRRPLFER